MIQKKRKHYIFFNLSPSDYFRNTPQEKDTPMRRQIADQKKNCVAKNGTRRKQTEEEKLEGKLVKIK